MYILYMIFICIYHPSLWTFTCFGGAPCLIVSHTHSVTTESDSYPGRRRRRFNLITSCIVRQLLTGGTFFKVNALTTSVVEHVCFRFTEFSRGYVNTKFTFLHAIFWDSHADPTDAGIKCMQDWHDNLITCIVFTDAILRMDKITNGIKFMSPICSFKTWIKKMFL